MSGELPVYDYRDNSKLPEVDESELDSLGVGLYRVRGKTMRGDYYRPQTDDWERDVDQIMLARVDVAPTPLPLPGGMARAEIRRDGARLICGWEKA